MKGVDLFVVFFDGPSSGRTELGPAPALAVLIFIQVLDYPRGFQIDHFRQKNEIIFTGNEGFRLLNVL